jgi:hypothetical protein
MCGNGKSKRAQGLVERAALNCALLLAAGLAVAACSSAATTAPAPDGGSRFGGLVGSAPVAATAAATPAGAATTAFNPDDCPPVELRAGAGSLSVSAKAADGTTGDVRYLLSVSQLARQCTLVGNNVVMKIGVEGRVILGPAGTSGPVELPLRYAVIQDGPTPKTVTTKFKMGAASVADGQANVAFSDVEDGVAFPLPSHADLASYTVYVGFDEQGDGTTKKPAPKKPKR